MRLYLRPIGDLTQYNNAADYENNSPFPAPNGFEWVEGEPPETATPYAKANLLEQLEQLIVQGQQEMAATPLPIDIQKQIFDLDLFIQNYYRRGATTLIEASVQGFVIPEDRTDVTADQRTMVEQLKSQMLQAIQLETSNGV